MILSAYILILVYILHLSLPILEILILLPYIWLFIFFFAQGIPASAAVSMAIHVFRLLFVDCRLNLLYVSAGNAMPVTSSNNNSLGIIRILFKCLEIKKYCHYYHHPHAWLPECLAISSLLRFYYTKKLLLTADVSYDQ